MTLPPSDDWVEQDWKKLTEEVEASAAAASGRSGHLQAPSEANAVPPAVASTPPADNDSTAVPRLAAYGVPVDDSGDSGGTDSGATREHTQEFVDATTAEQTEVETREANAEESAGEAEVAETGEGGRKRRRRRRRRRRGSADPAAEAPSSVCNEENADMPAPDWPAEEDALAGEATTQSSTPTASELPPWPEETDSDQAAEILRDILAHWNVPSWDEIVAGLHRPER
jgi:ribonuclease E